MVPLSTSSPLRFVWTEVLQHETPCNQLNPGFRWPRGGGNPSQTFWAITKLFEKNLTQREVIGTSSAFESWSKLFRTRSEAFKSWRTCSATNSTCATGSFPGNEGILLCRCSSATWWWLIVVYMTSVAQNWVHHNEKDLDTMYVCTFMPNRKENNKWNMRTYLEIWELSPSQDPQQMAWWHLLVVDEMSIALFDNCLISI